MEDDEAVGDLGAGLAQRLDEGELAAAVGRQVLDQQHAHALGHVALDLGLAAEALGLLAHIEHRQAEPLGDPGGEGNARRLAAGDGVEIGAADLAAISSTPSSISARALPGKEMILRQST